MKIEQTLCSQLLFLLLLFCDSIVLTAGFRVAGRGTFHTKRRDPRPVHSRDGLREESLTWRAIGPFRAFRNISRVLVDVYKWYKFSSISGCV